MIQRILNGSMLPVTVFLLFMALVSVILHSVYQDRVLGNLPEIYERRAESCIAFECADVADEGIAYCRNEVSELDTMETAIPSFSTQTVETPDRAE